MVNVGDFINTLLVILIFIALFFILKNLLTKKAHYTALQHEIDELSKQVEHLENNRKNN